MSAQKKVAFYTLGCKLNFSETSTIARNFQNEGFDRVEFNEKADIKHSFFYVPITTSDICLIGGK